MPPKKQLTTEQIIEIAYQIVRQEGFEALTARKLAKELNCSTQPIYQAFSDMKDLKMQLIKKALESLVSYTRSHFEEALPVDLSMLLSYVQFAREEKYLFQLIFTSQGSNSADMPSLIPNNLELNLDMIIYVNGIVMMSAYHTINSSEDEIRNMIIRAYHLFKNNEE